jgi:excisionase family DNA binding protein
MFTEQFVSELASAVAKQVLAKMTEEGTVPKRLFTVQEAAVYIGRSPKAVDHLIARGAIQVTRLDGRRQIDRVALDKLIEENTLFEM